MCAILTGMITAPDRRARLAVMAGFAIQGITLASIVTRLATIKTEFELTDLDIVYLLATVVGFAALGSIAAGFAAERTGSAPALRVALAGVSCGVVLPGFADSLTSLVVLTCAYGFFLGAVDALLNIQGVAVQDRYGRSIMTGFHAMWSGAAVVGAGYASVTIALDWDLLTSLLFVAAVGLALNAVAGPHLAVTEPGETTADQVDEHHRVPWWPVLLLAVPTFAMWATDSATSAWSGIYLQDGLDAAASAAPLAYGAYQLVLLVVRLVGDRLVARYGATAVVRVSGWVAVGAVALIVAAPSVPVVIVAFGVLGGGLALVPPLSFVAAARLDVPGGATAIARVNVSNYAGYVFAAVGIALLAEATSERTMFVVPLALIVLLPLMARRYGD